MAAKLRSEEGLTASTQANQNTASGRPFAGSLTDAQRAAQIGRGLQSWYQACLDAELPDKLAALVRHLKEQDERLDHQDRDKTDMIRAA